MAEADELCNLLFLWLKKRKQCEEKLLALAEELKNVHKISTVSQVVGSATSVVALSTAGIITFLTGGLGTPLLVATTVGSITGAAVDIGSSAIESIMSGSTMKEAKNTIREDEKIGKDIQEAIENLKKKCEVQQNGAHGPTDVGCEVATQIMGALARRNNIKVPLYILRSNIRSTFDQNSVGSHAAGAVSQQSILYVVTSVCYQLGIDCFKNCLKSSAKGLLVGVIGFGISLYSLISSCEKKLKNTQGTQASWDLQNAAKEIEKARRSLEEKLDEMKYDHLLCFKVKP
ncbi:hypothetical protein ABG768_018787 [Culter alburnus]|uniref:Apolipoprotein L3-like n=1 Tax=Culter alburnus TaxID=194366 RepID=A0AAW2ATC5_CULAL